jgi:hypothetical protein
MVLGSHLCMCVCCSFERAAEIDVTFAQSGGASAAGFETCRGISSSCSLVSQDGKARGSCSFAFL